MAQKSYPWGRSLGADSMVGYTAKEWYSIWGAIAKAGAVVVDGGITTDPTTYSRGVFYSIGGRLEVTTPGNARIDVDTGAALVEGAFFENDTAIGAGGDVNVGPATLAVVVRKNYSAIAYVPAVASAALFTVPAYTARVTVIDAASLMQDVARLTYWDIPLAVFDINAGGVISNWLDFREYADVETRHLFIPPITGIDDPAGAGTAIELTPWIVGQIGGRGPWLIMPDGNLSLVFNRIALPPGFISGTLYGIVYGTIAGGDIYARTDTETGACGEDWNLDSTYGAYGAESITTVANEYYVCVRGTIVPAAAAEGDILTCTFWRNAANALDTVDADVEFAGFMLEYIGWR